MQPNKLLTLIICIFLILSCSKINRITKINSNPYTQIGDLFLDWQIEVQDIKIIESKNGKVFNIKIDNSVWFDMSIELKLDFYDSQGVQIDNPWGWRPITIEAAQFEWVKFIAPNKNVENFKLYMKKAGS